MWIKTTLRAIASVFLAAVVQVVLFAAVFFIANLVEKNYPSIGDAFLFSFSLILSSILAGLLTGAIRDLLFTRITVPLGSTLVIGFIMLANLPDIIEAFGWCRPNDCSLGQWTSGWIVCGSPNCTIPPTE